MLICCIVVLYCLAAFGFGFIAFSAKTDRMAIFGAKSNSAMLVISVFWPIATAVALVCTAIWFLWTAFEDVTGWLKRSN